RLTGFSASRFGRAGAQRREQLVADELMVHARVGRIGVDRRAGDHETLEAERRQLEEPAGADIGIAYHREALDEGVRTNSRVVRGVRQVTVAVVSPPDLGHHLTIARAEARAGGTGHRREVGESGDGAADEIARRGQVWMASDVDVG